MKTRPRSDARLGIIRIKNNADIRGRIDGRDFYV